MPKSKEDLEYQKSLLKEQINLDYKITISDVLIRLRRMHDYSIKYIATKLCVSVQWIYELEHGRYTPNVIIVNDIAELYDFPVKIIFDLSVAHARKHPKRLKAVRKALQDRTIATHPQRRLKPKRGV